MEEDLKSFRIRVPRLLSDSPFLADILSNHYGIRSATISLLTGYDDLNFLLVDCKYANSSEKKEAAITQQQQQTGMFTLKFSNRWEARFYPQLCDAQNQLTSLLAQNGLNCPKLVTQVDETAHRLVQLPGTGATDHLQPTPVRLFTFIPGQTLAEWLAAEGGRRFTAPSVVPQLATEVGRLLGRFHAIIDQAQFCPPVFHEYSPLISLECWPQLRQEFTCQRRQISNLMDGQRAKMCEMVFEEFERQVLDQRQKFLQGLIHSDFNEANILLLPESEKPEICGLLDFGDCHRSFRLADLANAILYLYLHFREHFLLDADGHLLRLMAKSIWIGYCSETICPIPAFDLAHLLLFMQARLVSSLVYGLRTSRLEMEADSGQSMDYVLQTQQRGWTVLEELITNIEHRMDCLKFD